MPKLHVESEAAELNYLWPGHHVTEVRVEFMLTPSGDWEPHVDEVEIEDDHGLVLCMSTLTPNLLSWYEKQLVEASEHTWGRWRDEQEELWAMQWEERNLDD